MIKNKKYFYILLAFAVIIADRITKYLALSWCQERLEINNYCAFDLAYNRGISWGFFHAPDSNLQFVLISLVIAGITAFMITIARERLKQGHAIIGETLVIAGSISNLFDRLWYQGVIDFIELSCSFFTWPLFNIADMCIVAGVGIMLVGYYRS